MKADLHTITVTPLTSSIGARIGGVDLRSDLSEDVCEAIRHAFWKHYVLVFPSDKPVGPEEQNRLAAVFGTPQPMEPFQVLGEKKLAAGIGTNAFKQPDRTIAGESSRTYTKEELEFEARGDGWHTDSSFTSWIPRAATLRAEVVSPVGGDTSFSSQCDAYDTLSPTLQRWLQTLRAIHTFPPYFKGAINVSGYGDAADARFDAAFPPREHPVVVQHPHTGRLSLFVNSSYTVRIVGLARRESDVLLDFLFTHVAAAANVYRHHWAPGDLVAWEELTVLHRAPTDFAPHERKVVRVTAGQLVPTGPSEAL
jgi:taurine dioxygenase